MKATKLVKFFNTHSLSEVRDWAKLRGLRVSSMPEIYLHFCGPKICLECKEPTNWDAGAKDFRDFCSRQCRNSSQVVIQRREATCLDRYGNKNPNLVKSIREKKTQTFLRNYGVSNPSQSQTVKAKKVETFLENYGATHWAKVRPTHFSFDNPMHNKKSRDKKDKTNLARYGDKNVMASPQVREKLKKTFLEKYGVDNPRKSAEVKKKVTAAYQAYIADPTNKKAFVKRILDSKSSGYVYYNAVDQKGNSHRVQGYERFVVPALNRAVVKKISTKVPLIPYGTSFYSPDFVVTMKDGSKRVVEVKSTYTLCHRLNKNIEKFKAAKRFCNKYENVSFWLIVADSKSNFEVYSNPLAFARRCHARGLGIELQHNRK